MRKLESILDAWCGQGVNMSTRIINAHSLAYTMRLKSQKSGLIQLYHGLNIQRLRPIWLCCTSNNLICLGTRTDTNRLLWVLLISFSFVSLTKVAHILWQSYYSPNVFIALLKLLRLFHSKVLTFLFINFYARVFILILFLFLCNACLNFTIR